MTLVCNKWELLRMGLAEGLECRVEGFDGDFRFLSNFWPAPIEFERLLYPSVEHAYQAAKATDRAEKERIAALTTPGKAKRAGAKLPPRPDWPEVKVAIMEELVWLKFHTNPDLRALLLATGMCHLEETNTWGDRFWGVCRGVGVNHLGQILMRVRERLRTEAIPS
jgi:ribA/ribD-fused uncharacterized protein